MVAFPHTRFCNLAHFCANALTGDLPTQKQDFLKHTNGLNDDLFVNINVIDDVSQSQHCESEQDLIYVKTQATIQKIVKTFFKEYKQAKEENTTLSLVNTRFFRLLSSENHAVVDAEYSRYLDSAIPPMLSEIYRKPELASNEDVVRWFKAFYMRTKPEVRFVEPCAGFGFP